MLFPFTIVALYFDVPRAQGTREGQTERLKHVRPIADHRQVALDRYPRAHVLSLFFRATRRHDEWVGRSGQGHRHQDYGRGK